MRKNETIFCIKDYLDIKAGESTIITSIIRCDDGYEMNSCQCDDGLKLISISKDGIDYPNGTAIYTNWFSEHFLTQQQTRKKKLKELNK